MNNNQENTYNLEKYELNEPSIKEFVLRSPNKGKIYKGPNWRAYEKQSLGSIPRDREKILYQDRSSKNEFAFSSQIERFQEKNESEKYNFPGPGNYKVDFNEISKNHKKNPSISNKGYGSFASIKERWDTRTEFYSKFSPGPGSYKSENNKSIKDDNLKSKRYSKIYEKDREVMKKSIEKENLPGPGDYEPFTSDFYLKGISCPMSLFVSKVKRKLPYEEIPNISPGPGRYRINDSKDFDIIKDPNKTSYFFKDKTNKPENENSLEKIIYSPIIESLKKEIDYNKYKDISKNLNIKINLNSSPGPGDYEIKSPLGILKYDYSYKDKRIINQREIDYDKEKQKELEEINILKNARKEAFMPYFSPFDNIKNSANFVFKSKKPKIDEIKFNQVPGPSYYSPRLFERKSSFNINMDKKWF
jgi:hypothetical protein